MIWFIKCLWLEKSAFVKVVPDSNGVKTEIGMVWHGSNWRADVRIIFRLGKKDQGALFERD